MSLQYMIIKYRFLNYILFLINCFYQLFAMTTNDWYKNSSRSRSNQFSIYGEVEASSRLYRYYKTGYYFYILLACRCFQFANISKSFYCLIIARLASASKSIYGLPSTVTPTKSSLPLLNLLGDGYKLLTASPLSQPTHKPSPDNVNLAG